MNTSSPGPIEARVRLSPEERAWLAPVVRRLAMRLARRVQGLATVGDLTRAGWQGLADAGRWWRPGASREETLAQAGWRARAAMLDWLRDQDEATRAVRVESRALTEAFRRLRRALGRPAEEGEVAVALGLSEQGYRDALSRIAGAGLTGLVSVDFNDLADALDEDVDEQDEEDGMARLTRRPELCSVVAEAIEELPPRLQHVLALRYQYACSLQEIGEVLGLDERRATQLHCEAVHRLRAAVEEVAP